MKQPNGPPAETTLTLLVSRKADRYHPSWSMVMSGFWNIHCAMYKSDGTSTPKTSDHFGVWTKIFHPKLRVHPKDFGGFEYNFYELFFFLTRFWTCGPTTDPLLGAVVDFAKVARWGRRWTVCWWLAPRLGILLEGCLLCTSSQLVFHSSLPETSYLVLPAHPFVVRAGFAFVVR